MMMEAYTSVQRGSLEKLQVEGGARRRRRRRVCQRWIQNNKPQRLRYCRKRRERDKGKNRVAHRRLEEGKRDRERGVPFLKGAGRRESVKGVEVSDGQSHRRVRVLLLLLLLLPHLVDVVWGGGARSKLSLESETSMFARRAKKRTDRQQQQIEKRTHKRLGICVYIYTYQTLWTTLFLCLSLEKSLLCFSKFS